MRSKLQTYLKVISLSGLMAFVILTSCNVRKGIQQLVGQEVQKQLISSKTIQSQAEVCFSFFDEISKEKNNTTNIDFSTLLSSIDLFLKVEETASRVSFAQTSRASAKVGLYLLFMQLKTHH